MAANYPSSLPVKNAAGANLSTDPHSTLHDGMYDEIVAIATELGTSPKGTSASVKAKLDLVEVGAWTAWTPTITQAGSVTCTVNRAKYVRIGRTIHATAFLTVTGTGTASNAVVIGSLPVTAAYSTGSFGFGALSDLSASRTYPFVAALSSTTGFVLLGTQDVSADIQLGVASSSFTAALANTDQISFTVTYEAVS